MGITNGTTAFFTANPTQGAAPLSVVFTNQSSIATDYIWSLNGVSQGSSFNSFTFDTTGNYTVELIAYNNSLLCADTFALQIIVFDSLVYSIPNIFTPNGDGNNDFFGITVNHPTRVKLIIINLWGNEIFKIDKNLVEGFNPLWDGMSFVEKCLDGTYFYKIIFEEDELVKHGFLELQR